MSGASYKYASSTRNTWSGYEYISPTRLKYWGSYDTRSGTASYKYYTLNTTLGDKVVDSTKYKTILTTSNTIYNNNDYNTYQGSDADNGKEFYFILSNELQ